MCEIIGSIKLPDQDTIIRVDDVSKHFGDSIALNRVRFDIPKGSIFGLLGPNGAGKTTLIRSLTGITMPDSGTISFPKDEIVRIGYLPEERGLYRKMRVWEHAIYIAQLKGLSHTEAVKNLKYWFTKFGMEDWASKPVEALSKGMQQKLQFVITAVNDPEVMILDEPFSGFDPINAEELKNEIQNLHEAGKTIILSTHNMASVEELCTHVSLLNKGEIIVSDSLQNVRNANKQSIYEIEFIGSKVGFANTLGHQFEVKSIESSEDHMVAVIKAFDDVNSNDLLNALTRVVEIKSYREALPSMNDIFIELISEESKSESLNA